MSHGDQRERLGRPFWWLWTGQSLSSLGSTAQSLAMPLWVLEVTGSAALTGGAFAVQLLPKVLFSPWAGVLADRFDRRNLFILLNLAAAALTAAMLPAVTDRNLPFYYLLTVLLGAVSTFNSSVFPSLVPALVPASRVAAADAARELTTGATLALGPLLGTAVAVGLGFRGAVAANAASYLLAALLTLPVPGQGRPEGRRRRQLAMMAEGLRALFHDQVLRTVVLAEACIFLFLGGLPQFAVVLIGEEQGTATAGLFASGMGVGWLLVSAVVGLRRQSVDPTVMLAAGAATAAPVAVIVVASTHGGTVWSLLAGVLTGVHNLVFAMAPSLLCQRRAEAGVLGRVFAFRRVFAVSAQFGSLVLTTLASRWVGTATTLAAAGVAATLAALPPAVLALRRARPEAVPV